MRRYFDTYHVPYFRNSAFLFSLAISILFLGVGLVINFYAGTFASSHESNHVTDIILSNIPVFDVDGLFIYGAMALWAFFFLILLIKPQRLPFSMKAIALFLVVRSVFVSLTHLAPDPSSIVLPAVRIFDQISFDGDMFFSGHVGIPFLFTLMFWNHHVFLRWFFFATSLFFSAVVLLGHLHYSIDVLGAYFITFTIYTMAKYFFPKDEKVFREGVGE